MDANVRLLIWFDRVLDFGYGVLVDVSLGNLPRMVTSRSKDRQNYDSRLLNKREVKIATVEMAIFSIYLTVCRLNKDYLMIKSYKFCSSFLGKKLD